MERKRGADWYALALVAAIGVAMLVLVGFAGVLGSIAHAVRGVAS